VNTELLKCIENSKSPVFDCPIIDYDSNTEDELLLNHKLSE
jgi:hypothetical protein